MGCEPELLQKKTKPAKARKLDLPEGVPPLTSLYLYIAGSCNLACRHCWISPTYEPDNSKGQFLKLEYIKKAVTEAKPLGLRSVKLTGGEPMLHPQFREIVDYIDSENIGMIIETNGTLIDDEIVDFLKSKPHFNFISVSIDGANANVHDSLRGIKGSFKQAISGIKSLVKAGFRPQLICTLHKGNIAELEDVVKLAQRLRCGSIKFNHVQVMGRGDSFSEKKILSTSELIETFNNIDKNLKSKYNISIFFDIPIAFYSINKLLNEQICQCAILNILGITSKGSFALCGIGETTPELIYGEINVDKIEQIWFKKNELVMLRQDIPNKLEGICAGCIHNQLCLGNCIANNYHLKKKVTSSYYFCEEAFQLGLFPKTRIKSNYNGG